MMNYPAAYRRGSRAFRDTTGFQRRVGTRPSFGRLNRFIDAHADELWELAFDAGKLIGKPDPISAFKLGFTLGNVALDAYDELYPWKPAQPQSYDMTGWERVCVYGGPPTTPPIGQLLSCGTVTGFGFTWNDGMLEQPAVSGHNAYVVFGGGVTEDNYGGHPDNHLQPYVAERWVRAWTDVAPPVPLEVPATLPTWSYTVVPATTSPWDLPITQPVPSDLPAPLYKPGVKVGVATPLPERLRPPVERAQPGVAGPGFRVGPGGVVRLPPATGNPSRPNKRTKERKAVVGVGRGVARIANVLSETDDFVDAFWNALPDAFRTKRAKLQDKLWDLWEHWNDVDLQAAFTNLLLNGLEDALYGVPASAVRGAVKRSAERGYYAGHAGPQLGGRYRPRYDGSAGDSYGWSDLLDDLGVQPVSNTPHYSARDFGF